MADESKPTEVMVTRKSVDRLQRELERHFYAKREKATESAKDYALEALTANKPEDRQFREKSAKEKLAEAKVWEEAFNMLKDAHISMFGGALENLERKYGPAPKMHQMDYDPE